MSPQPLMDPLGGPLSNKVAIVTGAGRGLGRAHALELARQGARVVVNDLGTSAAGGGSSDEPARAVVAEIRAAGGEAEANGDDAASWEGARRLVHAAIETYGGLDVLVNNAGFVRDRMLVSATPEEWDAVLRVHLTGHFAPTRWAASWWREQHKAGRPVDARIVNTTSGAGLLGSVGQIAYSAAKAGIAAMTLCAAAELARYGVAVNAIAPAARTRMTETVFADMMRAPTDGSDGWDAMAPENVSPLVAWLAGPEAREVSGRVFEVSGGRIALMDGWRPEAEVDRGARWLPGELGPAVRTLLGRARAPLPPYGA